MLEHLNKYLDNAIKRSGAKQSVDAAVVVESSGQIIMQIIPALRPADFAVRSYKDATLTIGVADSIVGQELSSRQNIIIEALRDTFAGHRFEKLRLISLPPEEGERYLHKVG